MRYFNEYVENSFQKNRCTYDNYMINIVDTIDNWKDINVSIIDMSISRSLDRPFDKAKSVYHVYPVISVDLDLEVTSFDSSNLLFTKKITISTIINNRYLLLEDLTNDFENRIKGSTSALGVDVLAGAMGLTWLRGYSQYSINTPNNIISNEWLEILTNSGILLEEGFVFNSADPFGLVYMGYKTSETIADELGYDIGDRVDAIKNCVQNPMDNINFDDNYEKTFNKMLPDSEMSNFISNDLGNITTSFDMECNISDLAEEELNNIIQDDLIPGTIKNVYNAVVKIFTKRDETDNNWNIIQNRLNDMKINSKDYEESRYNDAENSVSLPEGWWIYDVELVDSKIYDLDENIGRYYLIERIDKTFDNDFFDNNDYNHIILDGELWEIKRGRNIDYSWNVETNWKLFTKNETDSRIYTVSLDSNDYSYSDMQIINEDITIKFISTDYTNGIDGIGNNNIIDCFEQKTFTYVNEIYDPNLHGILDFYLDSDHINFNDDFRDKIFVNTNGKYDSNSYNNEMLIDSDKPIILHNNWINNEILILLRNLKQKIIDNVVVNKTISEGMLPGEMVGDVTYDLYNKFLSYKKVLNGYINSSFKSSNMFISASSKVYYNISETYIKNIEKRLYEEYLYGENEITDTTDDAISEKDFNNCEPVDTDYEGISNDMENAGLLSGISIPIGADMTLTKPGSDITGWSENIRISIKQNPPYFCKEYYEKNPLDNRVFNNYIKYRNLNVFSPMAGVDCIVEESFNALNDQIIGAIDSGFEEIDKIQNETLRTELKNGLNSVTDSISNSIKDTLFNSLKKEQSYLISDYDLLPDEDIRNTVNTIIDRYNDDSDDFIENINKNKIKDEIIVILQAKVTNNIRDKYGSDYTNYLDIHMSAVNSINHQVMNAYDQAVTQTLKTIRGEIIDTYESFSKKIEGKVSKKISSSLSRFIPSGLPILPPFGWWCTINAWYIEVEGTIPEFKILDCSNEAYPNTIMGHSSQEYFRKDSTIYFDIDNDGIKEGPIGENKALRFEYNTGTFIIVPPGKTGVGDTAGGMDEIKEYGVVN